MTSAIPQYTEFLQQSQDAVRIAVDTWTRTVSDGMRQLPAFAPQVDAEAAVDRYFEFNEKLLAAQRDFAKQLVGYAVAAGNAVQEHAEPFVAAARATATV